MNDNYVVPTVPEVTEALLVHFLLPEVCDDEGPYECAECGHTDHPTGVCPNRQKADPEVAYRYDE